MVSRQGRTYEQVKQFFFASGIFFALIIILFLSPYLFFGKTYVPFDLLKWSLPWGDGQFVPVQYHYSWDLVRQMFPWQRFIAESISNFELPIWNPYNNFGTPNISFAIPVFLDVFYVFYLLSADMYMDVVIAAVELWTAGIGMFILMRYFGISSMGATLGGIAFMFNGSFFALHSFYWALGSILWVPFIILYLEKSLHEKSRVVNIAATGLFLAFSHLAGNAQNILQIGFFLTLWMFSRTLFSNKSDRRLLRVIFVNLSGAYTISILLSAVGFITFFELLIRGTTNHVSFDFPNWLNHFPESILRIPFLVSLAIPHFVGHHSILNPVSLVGGKWSDFVFGYSGLIPLLLAMVSSGTLTSNSKFNYFKNTGFIIIFTVFLTPIVMYLYARFLVFFTLCIAFLGGAGLDYLLQPQNKGFVLKFARWMFKLGFLLVTAWITIFVVINLNRSEIISIATHYAEASTGGSLFPMSDYNMLRIANTLSYFNFDNLKLLITIFIVFFFGLILFLHYRKIIPVKIIGIGIVLLTCLDLGTFFHSYAPVIDLKEHNFTPEDETFKFLKENLLSDRFSIVPIDGMPWIMPDVTNVYFRWYSTAGVYEFPPALNNRVTLMDQPANPGFLSLGNVKYLLTHSNELNQNRFPMVHDGKFKVYQNPQVLPRAFTVGSFQQLGSESDIVAVMKGEHFVPEKTVYLLETPSTEKLGPETSKDKVIIESYAPREVLIKTQNTNNRILILSDLYDPGWTAYVDGIPVPIYQAYAYFRAISLPSGKHSVRFHYQPLYFRIGLWISLFSLACVILLLLHHYTQSIRCSFRWGHPSKFGEHLGPNLKDFSRRGW
ncbi:MAG: hypothetical protein HW380_1205 [Magnetococcales bacterium]|nr:hypothetical protein [Magnetococcales bacterium]HIJ84407.1 YfhO family protein [Magnetococcales bacterium]